MYNPKALKLYTYRSDWFSRERVVSPLILKVWNQSPSLCKVRKWQDLATAESARGFYFDVTCSTCYGKGDLSHVMPHEQFCVDSSGPVQTMRLTLSSSWLREVTGYSRSGTSHTVFQLDTITVHRFIPGANEWCTTTSRLIFHLL